MEAVSRNARGRRVASTARERLLEAARSPLLILVAGCAVAVVGAGLVAFHVTAFTLDESVIERSAVHYTSNLPHSLLHDVNARATDRLYSLLLSIAFHFFAAANAIRFDHVLSVVLFVSAAVPVYMFSTTVLRSRTAAATVGVLSVIVPWLAITSALFTENLSYPLFWWMMLATSRSLARPSRARDAVALASIGLLIVTRVQFTAVFIGYLLALSVVSIWRAPAGEGTRRRLTRAASDLLRRCSFTVAVTVVLIAVLAYARASSHWSQHVETLLGSYSNVIVNKAVPPNMIEALGVELLALALGVGLLPALVSIAWYAKSIGSPAPRNGRWVVLLGGGIVLAVFLLLTAFAQLGYLGGMTEERYFFYVIPVFWLGAFAGFEDRNVRPGELALCALAFGFLYGAIPFLTTPFGQEIAFLAPVESISAHVFSQREAESGLTGLTLQDTLAVLAVLAGILAAVVWSRLPRGRAWLLAGSAAIVQLLFAGYAYAVIDGHLRGTVGRTSGSVAALGWVDSHARTNRVWWLDNLSLAAPLAKDAAPTEDQQRTTLFWNSHLTSWAALRATGLPAPEWPLTALPNEPALSVSQSTGLIEPAVAAAQMREVVGATDSAFAQLVGVPIAHSPGGVLTLTALSAPVRASWLASGLQPDGYLAAGAPAKLSAFAPRSRMPQAVKVELAFVAPPTSSSTPVSTAVKLDFGSVHRLISLRTGQSRTVTAYACFAAGRSALSGTLRAVRSTESSGGELASMLASVIVSDEAITSRCKG